MDQTYNEVIIHCFRAGNGRTSSGLRIWIRELGKILGILGIGSKDPVDPSSHRFLEYESGLRAGLGISVPGL